MKFLYGNEPYRIDREKEKIVNSFDEAKFVTELSELNEEVMFFLHSTSFFEKTTRIVVFVAEEAKYLKKIPEEWFKENRLLTVCYGNSKECAAFARRNDVEALCCDKVTAPQLKNLIGAYIKMEPHVIDYFIRRIRYIEDENVTLYLVISELDKLKAFSTIDEKLVDKMLCSLEATNLFDLGKHLYRGNESEAYRIVQACPKGRELAYFGAAQRYFRIGWKNFIGC